MTDRTMAQLDQDHTQWRAVLEAADELDARIPDNDPYAEAVRRAITTAVTVVRNAIAVNRGHRERGDLLEAS